MPIPNKSPSKKPPAKPNKYQIELLKERPDLAGEFDQKFGRGAAAPYLRRQYGRAVPAPHAGRRVADALRANPATAKTFDATHGAGMAVVYLLVELIDKVDELNDHLVAPKRHRVLKDARGEVVGVEAEAD